jgi:hypothetical protein
MRWYSAVTEEEFQTPHEFLVGMTSSPSMTSSVVEPADLIHYYALFATVVALMIFPIWTVSVLPWTDFGDHLARVYILCHYNEVPVFRQYYQIVHLPLPNLAIDLILTPVLAVVDPYPAAKLFASLSVVVFAIAVDQFGRAVHGAPTWLAIVAAFFFYNSLLLYGFVNYTWGLVMFLLAAAAWMRANRNRSVLSGLLAVIAGTATYVAHLSGFFFLCVFIGLMSAFEVGRARRITIWNVVGFLPLLPGLAAYFSLGADRADRSDLGYVWWNSMTSKVTHAFVLIAGYSFWMDAVTITGLLIVAAALVRSGKLSANRQLLSVVGIFGLAFCAFPSEYHTAGDADTRFIVPAGLVLVLCLTVSVAKTWARPVYGLLVGILALRIVLMDVYWQKADRISVEQLGLLRQVQEQSRIYPIPFLPRGRTEAKIRNALVHLAGYAVIDRHAVSGSTFAYRGQQPLHLRIPLPYWQVTPNTTVGEVNWTQIFANYDYIWIYHASPEILAFLDAHAGLRGQAGEGRLYRVGVTASHGSQVGSAGGRPSRHP